MADLRAPPISADLPAILWAGEFRGATSVPFHQHVGPELILVHQGACSVTVENHSTLTAARSDLFVLPGNVAHDQQSLPQVHTFYVAFSSPATVALRAMPRLVSLRGEPLLRNWIRMLCRLRQDADVAWDDSSRCLLLAILHRLAHIEGQRTSSLELDSRLQLAIAHLRANLTRNLTNDDVAEASATSVSMLKLLFRRHMGTSPAKYHRQMRMALAQRLLASPYVSVKEVAGRCGYADTNYFVRQFRREIGTPPGTWRRDRNPGK